LKKLRQNCAKEALVSPFLLVYPGTTIISIFPAMKGTIVVFRFSGRIIAEFLTVAFEQIEIELDLLRKLQDIQKVLITVTLHHSIKILEELSPGARRKGWQDSPL
jgi:hypothetical protein